MKIIKMRKKSFAIIIFTIAVMLLNSMQIIASGKVLYEKIYTVESGELLFVKMVATDVDVKSWDKDEVYIIVKGSERINQYLDFKFSYKNNVVEVVAEKKSDWSSWNNWSWSKDFKVIVKVPTKFDIDIKTSGSDIVIRRINGKILLATSGGDIKLKNSEGSLSAKTSGGDVEIENFVGNTVFKTSGGDIEIEGIDGAVEAKTSGGDIEIKSSNGKVVAGTSGGDIDLKYIGENEGVTLYTSGGSISVNLPSNFTADVLLKTSGGGVENSFKNSSAREISKSKFEGKYNGGGAEFSAKTSGGSIYVK